MIISTEQSNDITPQKQQATTPLQDELNALRQRRIAKNIVVNESPSSTLSVVDWHEKQKALKEAERKKREESRKLMQAYKAKESSHFDFEQKELTKEATEDDKTHLKELMEESLDGEAFERNEANSTVETAVTDLDDDGELEVLKEEEEQSEQATDPSENNPEEEDTLEIKEEKLNAETSEEVLDVNKPQAQEMSQEMIEQYQKKAMCGNCTIL